MCVINLFLSKTYFFQIDIITMAIMIIMFYISALNMYCRINHCIRTKIRIFILWSKVKTLSQRIREIATVGIRRVKSVHLQNGQTISDVISGFVLRNTLWRHTLTNFLTLIDFTKTPRFPFIAVPFWCTWGLNKYKAYVFIRAV